MNNWSLDNLAVLKRIFNNINDDMSKEIFLMRLQASITGDKTPLLNFGTIAKIKPRLKEYEKMNKKIIIFGAGEIGQNLVTNIIKDIKVECFADNNKKGKVLKLNVINMNELKQKYSDAIVIITPLKFNQDIYDQLISNGFCKENIINFGAIVSQNYKEQYFDVWSSTQKESFVDCGCFDGETSKLFAKWCNNNYSNIWAFEPDSINYITCKERLDLPNCKLYNLGTFDKETIVPFKGGFCGGSKIIDDGDCEIKTVKLDEILKNEKITFIKMDIEGAELKALQGTEKIIREQKPRLAICVYHNPEDIISIPKLILEYNPDYKLMLRHYGPKTAETVLYAF